MKINVAAPILDLQGEVLRETVPGPNGPIVADKPITIRDAIIGACLHPVADDAAVPGQAEKAFLIALTCSGSEDVVELNTDQAEFIKARVPKRWSPLIVGRVTQALDTKVGSL